MPGRNIYKEYVEDSYYHIYNRGVNKDIIYKDNQDFEVFLALLKRYLGTKIEKQANGGLHSSYKGRISLLAFCLMPNHFHLFIHQTDSVAMKEFMKSLTVAYSMYFNKKHKRFGPLFQQRYRAVRMTDDAQLQHITRYIHLNPTGYKKYQWSSYPYYAKDWNAEWIEPEMILELFNNDKVEYAQFVGDYANRRDELQKLKQDLQTADL